MTNLFQVLINFLEFILNPIYNIIVSLTEAVWNYLFLILGYIVQALAFLAQVLINGFVWSLDRIILYTIAGINYLWPDGIIVCYFGNAASPSGFVTNLLSAGAVGFTWMYNLFDPQIFIIPLITYVGFLLVWTAYKFVKSWIPTIGS